MTKMLNFLSENIHQRLHLAIKWVTSEYFKILCKSSSDSMSNDSKKELGEKYSHYEKICLQIINYILASDEKDSESFSQFISKLPLATKKILSTIQIYSISGNSKQGIALLCELILYRQSMETKAYAILKKLCLNFNAEIRLNALEALTTLYQSSDKLQQMIKSDAIAFLNMLSAREPPSELGDYIKLARKWEEEPIYTCLYMFNALLSVSPSLVSNLTPIYSGTGIETRKIIIQSLEEPFSMLNDPEKIKELLDFIELCPKGSEPIVLRSISILSDYSKSQNELVRLAKKLYKSNIPDIRIITPILRFIDSDEIFYYLKEILKLKKQSIIESIQNIYSTDSPAISQTDFLLKLHTDEFLADQCIKDTLKTIDCCFELKPTFKEQSFIECLTKLSSNSKIPAIFMRTLITCATKYTHSVPKLVQMLKQLFESRADVSNIIYYDTTLLKGLAIILKQLYPYSVFVMKHLPKVAYATLFELDLNFKDYLSEKLKEGNKTLKLDSSYFESIVGIETKDFSDDIEVGKFLRNIILNV